MIDIRKARQFAIAAHGNQMYAGLPYIAHLDETYRILYDADFEGPILVAAYLHDILEDTPVSLDYLIREFGIKAAILVWAVSGCGNTRTERNECIYRRVGLVPEAKNLKVADRIANLESAKSRNLPRDLEQYRREHREFVLAMQGADPPLLLRLGAAIR